MTTRREVPFAGDTSAWVHTEIGDMKSRISLVQQAVDQSRGLAAEAAEAAHQARSKVDLMDGTGAVLEHLQEDIHSLRQTREDIERRSLADAERVRQERNDSSKRFSEMERVMEVWTERIEGIEEHNRRAIEAVSHATQRVEMIEAEMNDSDSLQSRAASMLSRIDQDTKILTGSVAELQREDNVQRERLNTVLETLRRIDTDVESLKADSTRLLRLDDRLELVQAERTRHNERLNELTAEMALVDNRLNEYNERTSLVETRTNSFAQDVQRFKDRLQAEREQLASYMQGLRELEGDIRKRQIAALEKEIRDIRGRAFHVAEE